MTDKHILEDMCRIVRTATSLPDGVKRLHDLVRTDATAWAVAGPVLEGMTWDASAEVLSAAVEDQLLSTVPLSTTGFWFGIDGLNMPSGRGLEMGCSPAWAYGSPKIDYVFTCDNYCDDVPFPALGDYYRWYYQGLYDPAVQDRPDFNYLTVEYSVCLGATALALRQAFTEIDPVVACAAHPQRCVALGFGDGDIIRVGRATLNGFDCDATCDDLWDTPQ